MRSRIRVVGGAPPPPLDVAPQGPKNRRNSALSGPDFGGMRARGSPSRRGGEGGLPTTTQSRDLVREQSLPGLDPGISRKGEDTRAQVRGAAGQAPELRCRLPREGLPEGWASGGWAPDNRGLGVGPGSRLSAQRISGADCRMGWGPHSSMAEPCHLASLRRAASRDCVASIHPKHSVTSRHCTT